MYVPRQPIARLKVAWRVEDRGGDLIVTFRTHGAAMRYVQQNDPDGKRGLCIRMDYLPEGTRLPAWEKRLDG
jgi:hypothetical protein